MSRRLNRFDRHAVIGSNEFRIEIVIDQLNLLKKTQQLCIQPLFKNSECFSKMKTSINFLNYCRCFIFCLRFFHQTSITNTLEKASNIRLNDDNGSSFVNFVAQCKLKKKIKEKRSAFEFIEKIQRTPGNFG